MIHRAVYSMVTEEAVGGTARVCDRGRRRTSLPGTGQEEEKVVEVAYWQGSVNGKRFSNFPDQGAGDGVADLR